MSTPEQAEEGALPEFVLPGAEAVVYKTAEQGELRLHVFKPAGWRASDKRAAIVFFFGGGWVGGNPGQFAPHCRHLAARGMVAVSAEYRVEGRHGTTPFECVADGKSAVRWVRAHADELGIDPGRIAAGGGSAGGHVAAAAAMVPGHEEPGEDASVSSVPDALVLFNPALDLAWAVRVAGEDVLQVSPAQFVREGLPPMIVFHGTKDKVIPIKTIRAFCREAREAGNRCELHEFDGRGHGFFNQAVSEEDYAATVRLTEEFLESLGYLPE